MIRALYTSATGMKAQEMMIDNTANNLANVNTNGFKRSQVDFADLIYLTLKDPGSSSAENPTSPVGLQLGSGVRPVGTTKLFTQGSVEQTGNPLDVAIQGDGFLKVLLPGGEERYTRDGALRLNDQNQLVSVDGLDLADAITIPADVIPSSISIGANGAISGQVPGATDPILIGNILLYRFPNPAGLSSEGGNLYAPTGASGDAQSAEPGLEGAGTILQSFLERSNVEVVTELISLITAQRAYEVNSRAIRAGDEMLSTTNDIVR
jgi:flagellar basal-body rod protein FlgG